jgi:hypothetical protein
MNMSASVMLTGLPRDAHQALADVEAIDAGKGTTVHLCMFLSRKNRVHRLVLSID